MNPSILQNFAHYARGMSADHPGRLSSLIQIWFPMDFSY